MSDPLLDAALARGATVVTPNNRLAREIVEAYDARQAAAGRTSWRSVHVLPWHAFVAGLVESAQDARLTLPSRRVDTVQAVALWRGIVASDGEASPLVDEEASAALAAQAWERLHAFGSGGESWRGFAGAGGDVDAFVRWAEAYRKALGRLDAVDAARAPDMLAAVVRELPDVATLDVLLAGFTETSPQHERLVDALRSAGARVEVGPADERPIASSAARVVACETAGDELAAALDWARERTLRDPAARVGIVVLDLAERRAAVHAACEERLCAPLQWPGEHAVPRPYELSLGTALADTPLVASALALIALAERPLGRDRVAALLRSPHLPGDRADWLRRAPLERRWLERGVRELDWRALVQELEGVDANLAARWRWASGEIRPAPRLPPRAWVERWRGWLEDVAWCQARTLTSAEFQAQGAWNELLGTFARLGAVTPTLSTRDAIATLNALAREQVFQPESTGAPIRVLGILEAAGLRFDALWVAGMAAEAWPRAPEPNPFLPLAWQRERRVPRASADGELAFARDVTRQLAHAAPDAVFSYARAADEHRRTASPLLAELPTSEAPPLRQTTAQRMYAERVALEAIDDAAAPPLPAGAALPGGSGLIEKVAECPFRATAVHRLGAQPWPAPVLGLTPMERGTLVHATLHAFWRTHRDHSTLLAMDEAGETRALDAAYEEARAELTPARWSSLPEAVAASEGACVTRLVRQWLEHERGRPAFDVVHTEQRTPVTLAGYTLDVRLDRVDALRDGGRAVIDYKSGWATTTSRWFEPRPQGLQLALYALASEQGAPEAPVRALVYAQLRPGDVRAIGLGADAAAWPGLVAVDKVQGVELDDWSDARGRLTASLESAASAFGRGDAAVAPRDASKVCGLCRLHALCRVTKLVDEAGANAETSDDE